jgi:hypothetical protein
MKMRSKKVGYHDFQRVDELIALKSKVLAMKGKDHE